MSTDYLKDALAVHSHHNEPGADGRMIPIQHAGLHTYLRALDIRFMNREQAGVALRTSSDISMANSLAKGCRPPTERTP